MHAAPIPLLETVEHLMASSRVKHWPLPADTSGDRKWRQAPSIRQIQTWLKESM
jgi:hypothetical protein